MDKLTSAQKTMLIQISFGKIIYVFQMDNGKQSFSYYKDNTCARIYTTLTARSLLEKGFVVVKECFVEGSLDNCVGVLGREL